MLSTPAAIEWISFSFGIAASAPAGGFQHTATSASRASGCDQAVSVTPGSSCCSGSIRGSMTPGVVRNAILIMLQPGTSIELAGHASDHLAIGAGHGSRCCKRNANADCLTMPASLRPQTAPLRNEQRDAERRLAHAVEIDALVEGVGADAVGAVAERRNAVIDRVVAGVV